MDGIDGVVARTGPAVAGGTTSCNFAVCPAASAKNVLVADFATRFETIDY